MDSIHKKLCLLQTENEILKNNNIVVLSKLENLQTKFLEMQIKN